LKEVLPTVERVAVLRDPAAPTADVGATQAAARALGLRLHLLTVGRPQDLSGTFQAATKAGAEALIVLASGFFNTQRPRLIDLAAQNRLIAMWEHREFTDDGGLMSYGPNLVAMSRKAATYIDRILKGAKPAGMPIEQPTVFELVINLKTAKAIGLSIPASVLARADEIIE